MDPSLARRNVKSGSDLRDPFKGRNFSALTALPGQPSAIAVRMVLDPDDALFIENERCVQFSPVLERGGQNTNWHLVTARRADKLRPPRPRVETGMLLIGSCSRVQSGVRS